MVIGAVDTVTRTLGTQLFAASSPPNRANDDDVRFRVHLTIK